MAPRKASIVSVAAIRTPRKGITRYLFHQRQQVFTLEPGRRDDAARLKRALASGQPLKVAFDPRGRTIQSIETPTAEEVEVFGRLRVPPEMRGVTRSLDLSKVDPTTFDIVDHYLKVPLFRRCTKTIPNYTKAKEIFDFCAKQSCHLGGPYDISPCIPFQYVIDGCYARAHKMRKIITTKYRYCCEKVFSFATEDDDELAVKADKWGGCCVTWWFHVAPLVRVRLRASKTRSCRLVLAMVIDPSMFDKPVLLSTWLSAQENLTCSPSAKVSKYSIQPGSAYWPTNGAGTTFGTDPAYADTDATLNDYHDEITCP
jgi:hypothetical protein